MTDRWLIEQYNRNRLPEDWVHTIEELWQKREEQKRKGNKICPAGIAWAKRTFDTYPSAYANMAASKYCKDPNYAKGAKKKK